jgi:heavy metal sensor kinase
MTLTTRLSVFFLGALALVVVGFSGSLYGLARVHLHHQTDERERALLDTLTALVEFEGGQLEWAATERHLAFTERMPGSLLWAVLDERGRRVDGSEALVVALAGEATPPAGEDKTEEFSLQGAQWRLTRRVMLPHAPTTPTGTATGQAGEPPDKKRYDALELVVAAPLAPLEQTLRALALGLVGLSVGTWCLAALVGRRLCQRALAPVSTMAQIARSITAQELDRRLPRPGTADELESLSIAFNDLLTRLQDSFERQQRFTGEASHQLRTPLTAMLGQVEVALRRERPAEEYRRVLGLVQKQALHLRQIVEMLLFLARADAEARLPELQPLDLDEWLTHHLPAWEHHPRYGDIRREVGAIRLGVQAHPGLLGQALDNLLDNACKYSQPGTEIVVRTWRQEDEVRLAVEDHGYGIGPEELARVFEPFFRSPEVRRRGIQGIGLGLAVTARIIATLHGQIEVESPAGGGCRFVIRLPAREVGTEEAAARG